RERVRNSATKSTYVFTNEDLARPRILAGIEQENSDAQPPFALDPAALATTPGSGSEQAVKEMVVPVWPEGTPLGNVARYYRRLRELRTEPLESPLLAQDTSQGKTPVQNANALRVVRVSSGDSLWKIARRYLGDGNQWREIASANPEIADPNLIQVGQQIRLPGESDAVAVATNQVRVQAGDSLWKLAQAQWGNGQAWSCIAESNPQIQDFSKIYPGQTLALPATCSLAI
ncbi:MAG: LysM peptidoglycan-binding domain-containing protein, partial [Acidobacteria bacterium]|nr:LysM peptidoglycan-binding domain-containing protein [Acidobacteriota bacterium]